MTITKEDKDVKKKIIIAAMAGILAVVGAGATTAVAKAAGNEETAIATESGENSISGGSTTICNDGYTDSSYELSVNATDNKQVYPAKRVKYTYSPVYFNWGRVKGGNVGKLDVEPYGYDGVKYRHVGDKNYSAKRYDITHTGKYAVTSYIHELNLPEATIALHAKQGSGVIMGEWSPDCAGSYTILN